MAEALPSGFTLDQQPPAGFRLDTATPDRAQQLFAQAPQPQAVAGLQARADRPDAPTVTEALRGTGEAATTFLTGAFAQPVAGLAGIGELVSSFVMGEDDALFQATERINQVARALTFQPRTKTGQDILEMVSVPFEKFGELTTKGGDVVFEETGSPGLATMAKVGLESLAALPFIGRGRGPLQRRADVEQVRQAGQDIGVDVDAPTVAQRGQVIESAEAQTGGAVAVAQNLEQVQSAIVSAKADAKVVVDDLFDQARGTNAGIQVGQLKSFEEIVRKSLEGFDIQDMPIVRRRLDEISSIQAAPENFSINMNEIAKFRRRLNRNRAAATDTAQNSALGVIKGQLDTFLDAQFNSDMVTGNPAAIERWKGANDAFRQYKETFSDNKVIKQLAEQEATPEMVRRWIFGASSVGAKAEAGAVVGRIKSIVGEDSPQFVALRQDALFDIMEPLLREEPNFPAFARNYDKFVKRNPTLNKELFPDSISDLDKLRGFSAAIENNRASGFRINVDQSISRALFGHGIAKAGLKVSLMGQVIGLIKRAAGRSDKQRLMSELLGYDVTTPTIPFAPVGAISTIETAEQQ